MIRITLFLFFIFPFSHAMGMEACGTYNLLGVFHKNKVLKDSYFNVNESTKSELKFYFKKPLAIAKLMAHDNKPLVIKVVIDERIDGTKGTVSELLEIHDTVNVMNPFNESLGYKLLDKKDCKI